MRKLIVGFSAIVITLIAMPVQAQEWTTVERFSGSGTNNTTPFTMNEDHWRIKYESSSDTDAGHILQVYKKQPGESLGMDIIVNEVNKKDISGTTNQYEQGKFYFEVNGANGDWNIQVQVRD